MMLGLGEAVVSNAVTRVIVGRRTKYEVLLFWIVHFAVFGPLASKLTDAQKNDAQSWLPGKAESTQALVQQKAFRSPNTADAVVVYNRAAGLTAADKDKIAADKTAYAGVGNIDGDIVGPVYSRDGKAAEIVVPINLGHNGWNKAGPLADKMRDIGRGDPGLSMHVTGPAGYAADFSEAFKGLDGILLFAALGVVIVMLLLTYRSPVLWLLPVLSAGIALMVAQGVVYLFAKHGLTVNGQSQGVLTVLVFGAGTDYALLLVARYREELRRHKDRHEAMALALHRAGPAIFASGTTVILGLLCLLFAEMQSTKGLGPVTAIGVVVALASMLSLLPALLVICGRWVFWPTRPRFGTTEPTTTGFWARTGQRISRHPRYVWVGTALALGVLSIGIFQLSPNGLSNKDSFRTTPDAVVGEQVLTGHFPAGSGTPVVVVAKSSAADQVRDVLAGVPGIVPSSVTQPRVAGSEAYIEGTMTAKADGDAGFATVERVRTAVHAVPGAEALVGGGTAITLDVHNASKHDRYLIIPIVLVVVLLVLAVLLRAVIAPLVLVGTVVVSFGAAIGLSALFFKHVFGFAGTDTDFPLFVFVFLVALGIDYNIFLMTRVREEALKHGTRPGALIGLGATGGVITSAGLVLAGTFAVLGTLPMVGFAEIGFTVAVGVLLDTLIVRSVFVTALNLDIGDRMWWPSKLSRGNPDDDMRQLTSEESVSVS
jgi:RND superfamily putative drug exporter